MAVLSLFVLYVIGMNVFLSTSLFDRFINHGPMPLDIHYASGWSIWPGRIHAKDLSIRSSDSNVEWILRLDEVTFDVSLHALFSRRFEVTHARGTGISFRGRQKLDREPSEASEVAFLPPIPGYPAYSLRPSGPPDPERWDDSKYELITVSLEDVIAENVREIWVDNWRFEGAARVQGRFYLKPIRAVNIGPTHVDVQDGGRITYGDKIELAHHVGGGSLDVTVETFDPRWVNGTSILRHVSIATTHMTATTVDPATVPPASVLAGPNPLPAYVSVPNGLEFKRLDIKVDHGRVIAGTNLDIAAPKVIVSKDGTITSSALSLTVATANDRLLKVNGAIRSIEAMRSDGQSLLEVPALLIEGEARELDLATNPLGDAHAVIDVPEIRVNDARFVNSYLAATTPLRVLHGRGYGNARLEIWNADKKASAAATILAEDLDMMVAKMRTRGSSSTLNIRFGEYRWRRDDRRPDSINNVSVHLEIAKGSLASEDSKVKVTTPRITFDAHADTVEVEDPLRDLEASFAMPDAKIEDEHLLTEYLPKKRMVLDKAHARFGMNGHVTIHDHLAKGELKARSPSLGFTLDDVNARANIEAIARVHHWKWEKGDLAIADASVDVRELVLRRNQIVAGTVQHVHVKASSPSFALSDPFARIDFDGYVKDGRMTDSKVISAFLPDGTTWGIAIAGDGDGRFEGEAKLSITDHFAKGEASGRSSNMGIATKKLLAWGDADVSVAIAEWNLRESVEPLTLERANIVLTNARGRIVDKTTGQPQDGELTAKRIGLTGSSERFHHAAPTLDGVDAHFVIEEAKLPDARVLQALLPSGSIRMTSGSASAFADVTVLSSKNEAHGTVGVDIQHGGIAIGKTELVGDYQLRSQAKGVSKSGSFEALDISGSHFAMRNVQVRNAAAETVQWAGDLRFVNGKVVLPTAREPKARLDAVVRLDADDARPVLGILLRDSVPSFVASFVTMPRLAAYARLHLAPNVFLVSDVDASGGDVRFRGVYGITPKDQMVGAFVVEKGPLSVGIRMNEEGAHPKFFGLDSWLEKEEQSVRGSVTKTETQNAKTSSDQTKSAFPLEEPGSPKPRE